MRKILSASILILTFCIFAFGQNSNCPTISVTGPPSATQPGETATFTANVSGIDLNKIEYQWSVDKGTIMEGQGTSVITVGTEGTEDTTITATVIIKGLPEGCLNTDSETSGTYCPISSIPIDELEISSQPIDSERLDAWVVELKNDPNSTMYFIFYTNEKFSSKEIKPIEDSIKKHFADKKIQTNVLVFINEKIGNETTENRIRIWRVPLGAEPPTP